MSEISVGTKLPPLTLPPISRTTLALYAGASGDHNPIHIDIDAVKRTGMDDVFAHGMLIMAYLGRLLTNWRPQEKLRKFGTRFGAITHIHDEITCTGQVVEIFEKNGEKLAQVEVQAAKADGTPTLFGYAIVAI